MSKSVTLYELLTKCDFYIQLFKSSHVFPLIFATGGPKFKGNFLVLKRKELMFFIECDDYFCMI